ncbi:MAG: GntR family transcriptional regulator [Pseudomonadota bacterium]
MTVAARHNWQSVRDEVRRRIHARDWAPGSTIPNEVDLAAEFGCARTTVNRALQSLAEAGLLDRRRKAGTRVALHPAARATLTIAALQDEVTARGQAYGYRLLRCAEAAPPAHIHALMPAAQQLHLRALHSADGRPYALEDRWINLAQVPAARTAPFEQISGNAWLLANVPYTHGEIAFFAQTAAAEAAADLSCPEGHALLGLDRTTWDGSAAITRVQLLYAPGHRITTTL